ncbi:hypothetical protein [Pseudoalteromonas sp. B160]|uniref:hypothetical protein n=1 Tax=Pseudoalteromonas sp. B160 TaxID=630414 RepID=UPI00301D8BA2
MLVVITSLIISVFIIEAKKTNVIENANFWFFVATIGLISIIVFGNVAWVDLFEPSLLRVDDPLAIQDANKYDLSGVLLLENGHGLGHWQSYAIDRYIYLIYKLFGVETINVAVVNYLLRFISTLIAAKTVVEITNKRASNAIALLFFLPLGFYYSIMPSKEPLTLLFFSIFILFIIKSLKKITVYNLSFLFLSLLALSAIRLNLGVFCLITLLITLFVFLDTKRDKFIAFVLSLLLFLPINYLALALLNISLIDLAFKYENIFDVSSRIDDISKSGISGAIKNLSGSFGLLGYIVFLPLKMLIVLLSPFPIFNVDITAAFSVSGLKGKEVVNNTYNIFATLSGLINVFFLLPLISAFKKSYLSKEKEVKAFSVVTIVVFAIISLIYVSGFTRIRTLFEMLLFMLIIINFKYNYKSLIFSTMFIVTSIFINFIIKV